MRVIDEEKVKKAAKRIYSISGDGGNFSRVPYRRKFNKKKNFSQTFAKIIGFGIIAAMIVGTLLLLATLVMKGSSIVETAQTSGLPFGKKEAPSGKAESVIINLSPSYARPDSEGAK